MINRNGRAKKAIPVTEKVAIVVPKAPAPLTPKLESVVLSAHQLEIWNRCPPEHRAQMEAILYKQANSRREPEPGRVVEIGPHGFIVGQELPIHIPERDRIALAENVANQPLYDALVRGLARRLKCDEPAIRACL